MCILHKWITIKPYKESVFWRRDKTTQFGRKYVLYSAQQCVKCGKKRLKANNWYGPVWRLGSIGPRFIFPPKPWKPEDSVKDWGDGEDVETLRDWLE